MNSLHYNVDIVDMKELKSHITERMRKLFDEMFMESNNYTCSLSLNSTSAEKKSQFLGMKIGILSLPISFDFSTTTISQSKYLIELIF